MTAYLQSSSGGPDGLSEYCARLFSQFTRSDQRRWGEVYIRGLLDADGRKTPHEDLRARPGAQSAPAAAAVREPEPVGLLLRPPPPRRVGGLGHAPGGLGGRRGDVPQERHPLGRSGPAVRLQRGTDRQLPVSPGDLARQRGRQRARQLAPADAAALGRRPGPAQRGTYPRDRAVPPPLAARAGGRRRDGA